MIIIGSDHAGFKTKEFIKKILSKKKISFSDVGTFSEKRTDYPDYAKKVAKQVAKNKNKKGVLICGTGTGMCIAANKIKGIRAAFAFDKYSAIMARHDNDTNILCLRGRNFPSKKAAELVLLWIKAQFSSIERHKKRIQKIRRMENE